MAQHIGYSIYYGEFAMHGMQYTVDRRSMPYITPGSSTKIKDCCIRDLAVSSPQKLGTFIDKTYPLSSECLRSCITTIPCYAMQRYAMLCHAMP